MYIGNIHWKTFLGVYSHKSFGTSSIFFLMTFRNVEQIKVTKSQNFHFDGVRFFFSDLGTDQMIGSINSTRDQNSYQVSQKKSQK